MSRKLKVFSRLVVCFSAISLSVFGVIPSSFSVQKASAGEIPTYDFNYTYAFDHNTLNLLPNHQFIAPDVCVHTADVVAGRYAEFMKAGNYVLEVRNKENGNIHSTFENTLTNDSFADYGTSTDLLLKNNYLGQDSGINLICHGYCGDGVIEFNLINFPVNFFALDTKYTVSLKQTVGLTQKVIFNGELEVKSENPAPVDGVLHVVNGITRVVDLSSVFGEGRSGDEIISQNPEILSVGTHATTADVQITTHRPGRTVLVDKTNENKQLNVVVLPAFSKPVADLTKVVSITNPAPNSQDAQFHDAIKFLFEHGVTTGVEDKDGSVYYYGDNNLTRGEFAAYLYRFSGSPVVTNEQLANNFADVKEGDQFAKEIAWLKAHAISTGDKNNFYPKLPIKRGEIAKFVALAFANADEVEEAKGYERFLDLDANAEFTKYIKFLGYREISSGDSSGFGTSPYAYYYPDFFISRGQIAKFLYEANLKLFVN
ncbi:MAG: S-layer homology domain-containing protein [Candidatus Ancillula sp.]|jgi:hypothetical protein|nr:S-layer homology domain-containing protein [Candidatus Ancillula sp.]